MKTRSKTLLFAALTMLHIGTALQAGTSLNATPAWVINPGERSYVTSLSTERGIAYNPSNDHILLPTRVGNTPKIPVLDASDGSELRFLNVATLSGGTFVINHLGVDDDGVVYACNLVLPTSATAPVAIKIYRWANDLDTTIPTVAFNGDPSGQNGGFSNSVQRWGDTFAIRGKGLNTQIILGSSTLTLTTTTPNYSTTGVAFAIFTTSDGENFTPTFFPTGLESGGCRGIAFGEGDTFYSKAAGSTKKIRRSSFTLSPATTSVLQDHGVTPSLTADSLVPLAAQITGTAKYLATIEMHGSAVLPAANNPELVRLYDISSPSVLPTLLDFETLPVNGVNANLVGAIALGGGRVYTCATNSGFQAYTIDVTPDVVAPAVSTSPAARSVLERGQTTFEVIATGTLPLSYLWFHDDVAMPTATAPTLLINPVDPASAGAYKCRVTNTAGFADSTPANLTVLPSVNSSVLTELWHLNPGSRAYLQNDDSQRGLDYNPVNQHLYLVSRTPSLVVKVLDATNGAELGALDLTGVSGGTYPLNMIGVADDGVIYACNLSNTTDGGSFKIYRWNDDQPTTQPTVIYDGNPVGARIGDSFDVRGAGATTQLAAGARSLNKFVVLTTQDNVNFPLTVFTPADAATNAFGLSVAFGEGNTLWGKSQGQGLTYLGFNLSEASTLLQHFFPTSQFPGALSPIAVDPLSGSLIGISLENSDNVQIYDLPVPYPAISPTTLTLLDQEFFATDNVNANGSGAITLKAGKAFALNTNNGIVAYSVTKSLPIQAEIRDVSFNSNTSQITFVLHGEVGATYQIQRSADLTTGTWIADGTELLATQDLPVTRTATAVNGRIFFRAVKQ